MADPDWKEVAELCGVNLGDHLADLAAQARQIKFRRLMDKLVTLGWPDADTLNLSAWWETNTGVGIHLYLLDTLDFQIESDDFSYRAAVHTIDNAIIALNKARRRRMVKAAITPEGINSAMQRQR